MRILSKVCLSVLAFCVLAACGPADSSGDPGETPREVDVTITIINQGTSAWSVESVSEAGIAQTGTPNPSWTFDLTQTNRRYRIVNKGGAAHPLALLDRDGNALFSQEVGQTGSLENDPDIDYQEDEEGITFSLTASLGNVLGVYVCTFHDPMRGEIDTVF